MTTELLYLVMLCILPHLPCKWAMMLVLFADGKFPYVCPQGLAFRSTASLHFHDNGIGTANRLVAIILQDICQLSAMCTKHYCCTHNGVQQAIMCAKLVLLLRHHQMLKNTKLSSRSDASHTPV